MKKIICSLIFLAAMASTASAQTPANPFITLGTAGGPEADARSQPANLMQAGNDWYLVDAGDGAAVQLAKSGVRLPDVTGLFISHLHFDHTGGVLALLGLRMQLNAFNTFSIYGPPGTKAFVEGILKGMDPAREAAYGMPGVSWVANVEITELVDGSTLEFDGMTVHVAENSHFLIPESAGEPEKAKSLSFRFELEDRSILFTGDTGPSERVEELAQGADILISEMMDIAVVLETVRRNNPNMPEQQFSDVEWHLSSHHLLPEQVGEMAANAGVKQLIITHMVPSVNTEEDAAKYIDIIDDYFDGEIIFANDLDSF
jgi:ribonuclease BN (tRNA processing enzyme)